jgi:Fe-S-cluster containining protein
MKKGCRQCGQCCYYEIPITLLDIQRITAYLSIPASTFFAEYLQATVSEISGIFRIKKHPNQACIFLSEDLQCTVHEAKPRGCDLYLCDTAWSGSGRSLSTLSRLKEESWGKIWEKNIAISITKSYIAKNGTAWNATDFHKAVRQIEQNIVRNDTQKVKLARMENGRPIGIIFDCSTCRLRGSATVETPITLDDVRRISSFLHIEWRLFFERYVDTAVSDSSGTPTIRRGEHCAFFDKIRHCAVASAKPMHCRFTPCPQLAEHDPVFSALFLASGTIEEQYRHQIAIQITREYVDICGAKFELKLMESQLERLDRIIETGAVPAAFLKRIGPYRYIDDTQ